MKIKVTSFSLLPHLKNIRPFSKTLSLLVKIKMYGCTLVYIPYEIAPQKSEINFIIDKVKARLAVWKTIFL